MYLEQVDEKILVKEYLNGNEAAFEKLLRKNQGKVFGYIMKMVRDEDLANDIFQDTFVKVIRTLKKGKYNEEGKFLPWVMRIAHNLIIDHFRKDKKMPIAGRGSGNDDDEFDIFSILKMEDDNVEDEMIYQQILEDVKGLIDFLPEDQQEIVKMRIFMGMSFKDIADRTDVSINTALGRMRYALINLRKMVKERNLNLTLV
ncbi:RNA polymerase sigma factor [Parvicella tangerina]|uniref:RNA polymerase sigma-H factor n=1 Tax=Parvicella tangerina TaxID=2829795 RepID=A0A916NA38_9FLAO|nr:sigma-70 family RNA polymerase sigma factor [Parvicella tangerina]CAG5080062.1 RNA polymerase sigma-H factor [Parvicella tangerina]